MVETVILTWVSALIAGLSTPLLAACALPLYPGYLAFLANQNPEKQIPARVLGLIVTAGVIAAMFAVGLIFVYLLNISTGTVIGIICPILYALLAIVSIAMIAGIDISRFIPRIAAPTADSPHISAFLFGAFFGLIALPCNPGPIIFLFAHSSTAMSALTNFVTFVCFGVGMALPLLVLSFVSDIMGKRIISLFIRHQRVITAIAGVIMLIISLYYLIFVFGAEMLVFYKL
jgi:cytochrome c-type biogenesis protein